MSGLPELHFLHSSFEMRLFNILGLNIEENIKF
jgi:hypothetical protein